MLCYSFIDITSDRIEEKIEMFRAIVVCTIDFARFARIVGFFGASCWNDEEE
jgi:hypothetical protein